MPKAAPRFVTPKGKKRISRASPLTPSNPSPRETPDQDRDVSDHDLGIEVERRGRGQLSKAEKVMILRVHRGLKTLPRGIVPLREKVAHLTQYHPMTIKNVLKEFNTTGDVRASVGRQRPVTPYTHRYPSTIRLLI
jgi:hypothetical protein